MSHTDMWSRASLRFTAVAVVLLFAIPLFAVTPRIVDVTTEVSPNGEMQVTVISHDEKVSQAVLQVETAGSLVSGDVPPIPLALPLETAVTVPVRLHVTGGSTYGTVILRVVSHGEPVQITPVRLARVRGALRQVTDQEWVSIVTDDFRLRAASEAERHAAEAMKALIAKGRRPTPSSRSRQIELGENESVDPDSPYQRAWDRLAREVNPVTTAIDPTCGLMRPSAYNYSFTVRGRVWYRDERIGGVITLQESGYPASLVTLVDYQDDCGNYETRYVTRTFTTGTGGSFTLTSVRMLDDPQYGNPIIDFDTRAPDAGERTCSTCSTIQVIGMHLPPSEHGFSWNGVEITLNPIFTTTNSTHPYLFRWNDEIKSLQRRLAASGISSTYTPFKAGYDSTANTAAFTPVSPGLVFFGPNYQWTSKWVMAHEFGHFLQYTLAGNRLGGGQAHSVCQQINEGPAFREGFADWHGSWWETDGRSTFMPCTGGECYSNCGTIGWRVELNVAAFFWDIFDNVNSFPYDDYTQVDTVQYSLSSILLNWAQRDYTSFDDFYSNYSSRGLWGSQEYMVSQVRGINQLHVP